MKRKQYDAKFKATVALEAIRERQTLSQIACEYGVHPNQVSQWKKQLLSQLPQLFTDGRKKEKSDQEQLTAELYQQIGQLKVELDWLKKKVGQFD
jgi:transposase-like protein